MPYEKSQMLNNADGYYNWSTEADKNNAYYQRSEDNTTLDRSEGYEVLYFINHIATTRWSAPELAAYHKIETQIRNYVPEILHSHLQIEQWIFENWNLG